MDLEFRDLYWLSGIIEGEGSFGLNSRGTMGKQRGWTHIPTIQILMSDEDIINRVSEITKSKVYGPYDTKTPKGNKGKTVWQIVIRGNKAIQWMMTLYSLMGNRRKEKIEEIITYWKNNHKGMSNCGRVKTST